MKTNKKLIVCIIAIISTISIISGVLFCSAETDYGSFEKPVQVKMYSYHRVTPIHSGTGLMNGDFKEGYKYWTSVNDCSAIKTEGDNTYLNFDGRANVEWDGINSVLCSVEGVHEGDTLAVLYKWRGDAKLCQIYLTQWDMDSELKNGDGIRLSTSMNVGTPIYEAFDEGEWNIAVTGGADGTKNVQKPKNGSDKIFVSVGIQVCSDPTIEFDIDDLQIVKSNKSTRIVYDLSGKQLYDLNNLEVKVVEEADVDLSDFDLDSKKVPMPSASGMFSTDTSAIDNTVNQKKNTDGNVLLWIIIAGGAVIIMAAGAAIAMIIIKKKKMAVEGDLTLEAVESSENEEGGEE